MIDHPGIPPDRITRGLGLPRRIATIAAGLAGAAGAVLIAGTWLTEPVPLPERTRLAFAALILLGLAWAARAGFALARWPLFAVDRVITAALAVCASTGLTGGLILLALTRARADALLAAAGLGMASLVPSAVLLCRAVRARSTLRARYRQLEAELTGLPRLTDKPANAPTDST
jgi:hypothetical protein